MVENSLITLLQNKIYDYYEKHKYGIKIFLFGSTLSKSTPGDIDLLIVYDASKITPEIVVGIKKRLQKMVFESTNLFVDICMLSLSETRQSKFIQEERCEPLFKE